jgi:hypothetical protein
METEIGYGTQEVLMGKLPQSDDLKRCLKKAIEISNGENAKQVYAEHLLEGIIYTKDSAGNNLIGTAIEKN